MGMSFAVSSAATGGHGLLRAFEESIGWAPFGPTEIRDPRGVRRRDDDPFFVVNDPSAGVWLLALDGIPFARIELPAGLDPGGGAFGTGDTYYVGSRSQRSIYQVDLGTRRYLGLALALDGIAFPRGFAPLSGGGFIVASGTHPVSGEGRRAVFCYDANGKLDRDVFVDDPLLDPLDLALHNGYVYVTSEFPFGKDDATVSLRRYDARNGAPAGTWSAENTPAFTGVRKPRGIAFADDGVLLMCAQKCVLAVDVTTFGTARVVAEDNDLAGQSLALGAIVTRASRL
jgi:outer membrane protein assembly factor BamB